MKILLGLLGSFFVLVLVYLVFIYSFFRIPKPIIEYEFPNMTYEQLEVEISKISDNKINAKFNLTQEELLNPKAKYTRKIVLGKDSLRFAFVTKIDKGFEFRSKHNHTKDSLPWLELYSICNSKGKDIGVFRKNREEYAILIKLFEDDFIKKINNGKVNVIEPDFWDWF